MHSNARRRTKKSECALYVRIDLQSVAYRAESEPGSGKQGTRLYIGDLVFLVLFAGF
jgi:hypothetical protein